MSRHQIRPIRRKESGCTKDRFKDFYDAKKRAAQIGLRAYKCPHCWGFHLTSKGA